MTPDQERILFDYLSEGKTARTSHASKLEEVATAQQRLFNEMQVHFVNDEAHQREMKQALKGLDSRVDKLETATENTGRFQVDELRAKLKEQLDQGTWWKRWGVQTLGAVFLTLFGALVALFAKGK